MLAFERQARQKGFKIIIGIDEAGRGPLAGPVVASAVHLRQDYFHSVIRDSKQMTALQREKAYAEILERADIGLGLVDARMIDRVNILQATFEAMKRAVQDLLGKMAISERSQQKFNRQAYLLVDGNAFQTDLPFCYQTIIQGDSRCLSIACASIVAKVTRDRLMCDYSKTYPVYGFAQHKGYPTRFHKQQIQRWGLTPLHRKTFHTARET